MARKINTTRHNEIMTLIPGSVNCNDLFPLSLSGLDQAAQNVYPRCFQLHPLMAVNTPE